MHITAKPICPVPGFRSILVHIFKGNNICILRYECLSVYLFLILGQMRWKGGQRRGGRGEGRGKRGVSTLRQIRDTKFIFGDGIRYASLYVYIMKIRPYVCIIYVL